MKTLDKTFVLLLIIFDAIAIIIGMVAGPLGYNSLSIGASLSAAIISTTILIFGLILWKKGRAR